ncbi:MAG TPA: Asp-tRNA(Asn)/Glu-tRNA(Gln) amidotransferase subunit GatB [Haliangiales bacterium]|nr:Asp-tRNA(Asn)/Glu-tRNA(Gln) amidotransferase subunit GatB [Haliangiales bacterium]
MNWEPVIGLECHVQLHTASKSFSPSAASFGAPPNTLTDPPVLGLPGALPVLNRRAVELALRLGLATGSTIRRRSRFARKHYFYPDLPKGYQISQYEEPVCEHGHVELVLHGERRRVRLTRIHLEEDAGKNIHGGGGSLVDLNRAGVPLVEVVSEPDLRSAEEAAEYMRALRQLVRYLDISDGNMEEGSLRCDANVSVRPAGEARLGTKAELKNINSFKFVQRAIEHEIARQISVLEAGDKVVQETRLWDADKGTSASMRSKEHAHDYRYFPDPDLPPLAVADAWIDEVRAALPELPLARRARLAAEHGLGDADAKLLTEERSLADYFEAAAAAHGDGKKIANWVMTELLRELHRLGKEPEDSPVPPDGLAELVRLVDDGTINGKIAKDVFHKMIESGGRARDIVAREGLTQLRDTGAIEEAARAVVAANPKQVEQYRAGKTNVLGFFVGQTMKATGGKANPQAVNEILRRLLEQSS